MLNAPAPGSKNANAFEAGSAARLRPQGPAPTGLALA